MIGFISGPYNADTEDGLELNIVSSGSVSKSLWLAGIPCLCPHYNTLRFGGQDIDENLFYKGYEEMLKRQHWDFVLMLPNWHNSKGARRERKIALKKGIPIFTSVEQVIAFNTMYVVK